MCMRAKDATGRAAAKRRDKGCILVRGVLEGGKEKEGDRQGEGKECEEMWGWNSHAGTRGLL